MDANWFGWECLLQFGLIEYELGLEVCKAVVLVEFVDFLNLLLLLFFWSLQTICCEWMLAIRLFILQNQKYILNVF